MLYRPLTMVYYITYHPLHATVAQSKNCLSEVNTTIELKNIRTTSDNIDIQRHVSNNKCASAVGCSCYIFQISHSINSKLLFFDCATTAFSE